MAITPPSEDSIGRRGNLAQHGVLVVVTMFWLFGLG
jgi:hypothetical protein